MTSGEARPAATRAYWRMACTPNGDTVYTRAVDTANSLVLPAEEDVADGADPEADESVAVEISSQLSQDPEATQASQATQASVEEVTPRYKSRVMERELGKAKLTGEQKAVLHALLNSKQNVFYTGAAGTGKSLVLRLAIAQLRHMHGRGGVFVTAPTGIAACNVGGTTLHRWAGLGLARGDIETLVKNVKRNRTTRERWRSTKVLIVDEISMLSVPLLTKLEAVARGVRGNELPFGGVQLIFTGDLFQLPPIDATDPRFCFEASVWSRLVQRTIVLTQGFRQRDARFANLLNELRLGVVSDEAVDLFKTLDRAPRIPKGIVPTQLFPTRAEVSGANTHALQSLAGTVYEYQCADWRHPRMEAQKVKFEDTTIAEEKLTLKVGAQVMLIKNLDDTLVNGSIGRIVGFQTPDAADAVGDVDVGSSPYSGGSSGGIGKSAASLADQIETNLGAKGKTAARKRRLAEKLSNAAAMSTAVLPVVKFVLSDRSVRYLLVQPEKWDVTNLEEEVVASRTQVPLILAWALSVHKAQGQTLEHVSVNLGRTFATGQAYVALSRATTLDGLQVRAFAPQRIRADPRVAAFYRQLSPVTPQEIAAAEKYFAETFELGSDDAPKERVFHSKRTQQQTLLDLGAKRAKKPKAQPVKAEPKKELKVESKVEPKVEAKIQAKAEPMEEADYRLLAQADAQIDAMDARLELEQFELDAQQELDAQLELEVPQFVYEEMLSDTPEVDHVASQIYSGVGSARQMRRQGIPSQSQ